MNGAAITLFLDFDGVLSNDAFARHQSESVAPGRHRMFDATNLAALDYLCESLPIAQIVVTSSLRRGRSLPQLQEMLAREGFLHAGLIRAVTPNRPFDFEARTAEIHDWCGQYKPARVLVLDDMRLPSLSTEQFFQVDAATGFTMADARKLVARFS